MSQADIDEWLGAQAGGVDENVLEAMRGIADQGAMRVPAARAAAVPPAPDRNADQGETGLRWTASSSASGIEAWGGWSQTERDMTKHLTGLGRPPVPLKNGEFSLNMLVVFSS